MSEFAELARTSLEALKNDESVALASVVRVRGSSPRHIGARMLVWPDGRIVGTIGGGTLEYRVVEDARAALDERTPRLANYVFDTSGRPGSVGLCGGSVDIHIDVPGPEFAKVARASLDALERGETVALASIIHSESLLQRHARMLVWPDGRTVADIGGGSLQQEVVEDARAALADNKPRIVDYPSSANGKTEDVSAHTIHLDILRPDPTLLIIGAGHVAQPLAVMGSMMGMRVCVVDDRVEWANHERFPTAAEIAVIGYEPVNEILDPIPFPMTPATYVVVTTWGYDLPAMEQALQQNPAYIGLVGSPTKARVLFKRMRQTGYADEALRKIRAPIGLDVGAESPAEIAVSILGEVMAVTRQKSGKPLGDVRGGRIHPKPARSIERVTS